MFKRDLYQTLISRLREPRRFIQVLSGPRQVGKTTLAQQVMADLDVPIHYGSADDPSIQDRVWLEQQWDLGRLNARGNSNGAVLILDEIQKIPEWSGVVKQQWDGDTSNSVPLKCVLLGSSPLLVQRGLTESLAGRFEVIHVRHWSYAEMRTAFGWGLDQFIFFGGYPGSAPLIRDPDRWSRYILDSLIETTLSRDVLLMTRVDKPALLRRLFQLSCNYSGQILSYQKMLGQLHDAGNTTTLAHYLDLLNGAGMVTGIQKFAGSKVRQRASSPKLQVMNTALISSQSELDADAARKDPEFWGRLVESAVGAHLMNTSIGTSAEIFYWRDRNREVDFVLRLGDSLTAIEVKSGRHKDNLPGMEAFSREHLPGKKILIGQQGIPLDQALKMPASDWLMD